MNNGMMPRRALRTVQTSGRGYCCAMPSAREAPAAGLQELPPAMAYVPVQLWGCTYSPERALCRGTLFPPLDLPLGGQE